MDIQKTGQLIARTRKEQGLTQRELAERLHVSDRAVSKWERGLNLPEAALFEPLCQALNLTVVELLHGERVEATVPALEQAVDEAVALAGEQERRRKRCWRAILVLLALLAAAGVLIGRPMWEDCQRQKYWDRDNVRPTVHYYRFSEPNVYLDMKIRAQGFYGPFETDNALFGNDLAICAPMGRPPDLQKVELGPVCSWEIRFQFVYEKSDMEIKVLRWPYGLKGTDVGLEDGEEVSFSKMSDDYEGHHGIEGPAYVIRDLEPEYLYSVVIFWGDGYFAEYPFYTVETGG